MSVWSTHVQKQVVAMDDERGEVRKEAMMKLYQVLFPQGSQVSALLVEPSLPPF